MMAYVKNVNTDSFSSNLRKNISALNVLRRESRRGKGLPMGDMGDMYKALKEHKKKLNAFCKDRCSLELGWTNAKREFCREHTSCREFDAYKKEVESV